MTRQHTTSTNDVIHITGPIIAAVGAAMGVSGIVALLYRGSDALPLIASAAIAIVVGVAMNRFTSKPDDISIRESYITVSLAWLGADVFGALPYWFAGVASPLDAFFESISGFTTTGASIFPNPESCDRFLLCRLSSHLSTGGT